MKFPVVLQNTTDLTRVVGGLWFPPKGTILVQEHTYNKNKTYIDSELARGVLAVAEDKKQKQAKKNEAPKEQVKEESKVEEIHEQTTAKEESTETEPDVANESIIDLYAKKEAHWKTVKKEIETITDLALLEKLLQDAYYHNLPKNGTVFKLLQERIAEVEKK